MNDLQRAKVRQIEATIKAGGAYAGFTLVHAIAKTIEHPAKAERINTLLAEAFAMDPVINPMKVAVASGALDSAIFDLAYDIVRQEMQEEAAREEAA